MSETNTMFNERDRRCAAVQLLLSTDTSYDNRTISSTLKMQIWTVQHLKAQLNSSDNPLEVVEWRFRVRATSCHLTSLKSAWKSTPKCTWMCWRVCWSPGAIRWPVADPGCCSRTLHWPTSPKRPRLGFRRSATTLYPSLTGPPPPLTWTCRTSSFGHTSITSPTWPPATPKSAWSLPSAEYSLSSHWRLWKRHAPSSGSVSRRWLRLKAATLNRCQLYYIIKLTELIFFNKSFKIKLLCCGGYSQHIGLQFYHFTLYMRLL